MLPELIPFEEEATLIMRSGIQFMDFGLTVDLRKIGTGEFVRQTGAGTLIRLQYDEAKGQSFHVDGDRNRVFLRPEIEVPVEDSIKLLQDLWVPVPMLRHHGGEFVEGPVNWARARIAALRPGEDLKGRTHRVVIAFDTNVTEEVQGARYLAPTMTDVSSGAKFQLAWRSHEHKRFPEQDWISEWLEELYRENAGPRLRLAEEDVQTYVAREMHHHAHYLNLLWLIGSQCRVPRVKILSNTPADVHRPIQVDMVLDVGNSRTCGILIEDHPQEGDGLRTRYELELRDLSRPVHVYAEPFESRIEFAEAVFGKVNHSAHSGRRDAFLWPTIARVGPEASRLASRRRGTEGSTGLSSPKRYLWDEDRYEAGWRFNEAFSKAETEPQATAAPFSDLINEDGEALFTLPGNERYPVFMPHYSRSSLMTFMLSEVLVQALTQMNSPGQRMKMSHANTPRQLRSIILTVPPSMPKPERDIFQERMRQAIALVWKALGWHPAEDDIEGDAAKTAFPPLPGFKTQWDEATCAQVVYLFSETINHFGGRPEDFIRVIRRKRPGDEAKSVTIASIDIGGGTTDLVITDYSLDGGRGGNVYILPEQRFRDGFKVAGDDIVLEVIQAMVVPAVEAALVEAGLHDPGPLLSKLIGSEADIIQNMVLRQQLALQVLYPLGLKILRRYEQYDPVAGASVEVSTIGEMFGEDESPSFEVLDFVASGVRRALQRGDVNFDLLSVRLPVDLNKLHTLFLSDRIEICKTIRSLCEIVFLYDCDVLLISGRPSRLPGVQALFRALLALPPDRVVPMHNYRTGTWYPFHRQGRINDPKTTAAVGAMLCVLGQGRIPNFFFRANAFRTYSTVRHIGLMDQNHTIKDVDVYYRDIDLDDPGYVLPDTTFEMRGRMVLGFRQLACERWGASPLYMMEFHGDTDRAREALYGSGGEANVLQVTLKRDQKNKGECLEVDRVTTTQGGSVPRSAIRVRLCTLNNVGIGEQSYWLDTGSIVR
jgi:Uncharacterized protein conserved in bacteria, putative virulence factor